MFDPETLNSVVSKISTIPLYSKKDELANEIVEIVRYHLGFHFVGLYLIDFTSKFHRLNSDLTLVETSIFEIFLQKSHNETKSLTPSRH